MCNSCPFQHSILCKSTVVLSPSDIINSYQSYRILFICILISGIILWEIDLAINALIN